MDTPAEPLQVTTSCRTCGGTIAYEPVIIFGRDLAASIHTICDVCQEAAQATQRQQAAIEAKERARDLMRAALPPDLLATDRNHPGFNGSLWSLVKQWTPTTDNFTLGIIGPAALCKTRVMALLARRVVARGTRIHWTSAVRLRDAAGDRNSRVVAISAAAREHLADCRSAPWLFLDDFGKNEWSPSFESQLFQILDHRIGYRLPTVWSANAHPEDFSQLISPLNAWPIIGRLLDRTTLLDLRK